MFAVIYRWRVIAGLEAQFEQGWAEGTKAIAAEFGGGGSRLHRGADGVYVAYAQWPDEATWRKAMETRMHHSNDLAREMYRAAIDPGSFETLFAGPVAADLLEVGARGSAASAPRSGALQITPAGGSAMSDQTNMARALELARAAAVAGEAPVGCVIVDESGTIVAEAANAPIASHDPTAHAEIVALRKAAAMLGNYRLKPGLTLYVTLEPCAMCAGAISHARIARLVYGASDEKGGGVAHGSRVFAQATCHWEPEVTGGVLAGESAAMLRGFFAARR